MVGGINTREVILSILMEVNENDEPCHLVLRNTLAKYQFLSRQDRAFITRVCEGTVEYRIQIDYILNHFSRVNVNQMKPVIREILRSGVYQLRFMDSVPDSAVCNEAVKLTQKKGFYNLKAFVNGVLRNIARNLDSLEFPDKEENLSEYLQITYSMPEFLVDKWLAEFGPEITEQMLKSFLTPRPVTVRLREKFDMEKIIESMESQGVTVKPAPYLPYAMEISDFNHILTLKAFLDGQIQVQDVSSMLVAEIAAPSRGDYIIDLCAAPGGKSLHMGDKMGDYGTVDARDLTPFKVSLIEDNIHRLDSLNVQAKVWDATVLDLDSELKADIVLADVPCSGYGVIGRKPDIKYHASAQKQDELVELQRSILDKAAAYVKPRGVLIFSTCTISREENEDNMMWFLKEYPFRLESLDPYIPDELKGETTELGYLKLLPGVDKGDGFFMARFRRK